MKRRFAIKSGGCVALLLLLASAGCATYSTDNAKYKREGVQYGVTKGSFRGRWWNYYERGRSFQDGSFFAEAESDFRTALRDRTKDQLWARTYGLHFTPEYFPHRELGITLHYEQRDEEAVPELENSLQQRYSARASYFLNEARAALVRQKTGQQPPPSIDINDTTASSPVGTLRNEITGIARSENFISRITINGEEVPILVSAKEVNFAHEIALRPGQNEVDIVAVDLAGQNTTQTARIEADLDGPALSFDSPVVLPGTIHGIAFDQSGVDHISVAGQTAALTKDGTSVARFTATIDRFDANMPLVYETTDRLGNATKGTVPVNSAKVAFDFSRLGIAARSPIGPLPRPLLRTTRNPAGQIVLATTAAPSTPSTPSLTFENLRDGQEYLRDEIVVALRVDSPTALTSARLNQYGLDVLPDRQVQYLSRRIPLNPGANEIAASIEDTGGRNTTAKVSVSRRLTALEERINCLNVALLGLVNDGNVPTVQGESEFILNGLIHDLEPEKRFNLLDRSMLPEALTEQQLSAALGSREGRLSLNQVIPSEVIFVGHTHRDPSSIEIVLNAYSTETGLEIARSDVAGRADTPDQLAALVGDLTLRVVQDFPRVEGEVARVRGSLKSEALPARKPTLAVVTPLWEHANLSDAQTGLVADELQRGLQGLDRFTFVDRAQLGAILTEQRISETVGAPDAKLALEKLVPADMMLSATLRVDGDALTAVLQAVNASTTEVVAQVQTSGTGVSDDTLRRIGASLAQQLNSTLPDTIQRAEPAGVPSQFVSTLNSKNLVRESMKYVVYRYGPDIVDPVTKEVLGRNIEILGEGLVRSVNDTASTAEVLPPKQGAALAPFAVGDFVATK